MPHIIVTAGPTDQQGEGTVMLRERVNPADFESERFAANLVERLGWAVLDASQEEHEVRRESAVPEQEPAPRAAHRPITGSARKSASKSQQKARPETVVTA
jgi:hypothetical protein